MFRRILVPLDGSGRAEQAIRVATRMAHSAGGSIVLLRIVDTSMEHHPAASGKPTLLQSAGPVETRLAESYLGALAQSDQFDGIAVQTRVLRGLVAPTILANADAEAADIIVICSHGYTGVTRWMLGSVAEKVAHYANVPVLILREGGPTPGTGADANAQTLQVFIPLDGSAFAEAALAPATQLASALTTPEKVTLHLTHIVRPGAEEIHEAQRYLESTIERFRTGTEQPFTLTNSVVTNKDVAHTIINVAEHADEGVGTISRVIAMTTYGQGGQSRWATGSIAGRVLNATKLPLLIVRPT